MKTFLLCCLLAGAQISTAFNAKANSDKQLNIIPKPSRVTYGEGFFELNDKTQLLFSDEIEDQEILKEYVSNQIFSLTNCKPGNKQPDKKDSNNVIFFIQTKDKDWGKEEYRLKVDQGGIEIEASSGRGFFYGIQSLLQLIPQETTPKLPFVTILDKPEYQYRGMHLDVCRHFFPVEFIKKYIDLMAMYKMNTFHWHLTEDQGWRIEIKKYPRLTEIGAWRTEKDGSRYGGFYTQAQIKDIVQYASERFISVVPEIELPGHSVAALAAYPELACNEGPFEVANDWGVFKDVYCAGKESTFEFLQNVLLEVIELFPSKYIHIGGDECPKASWEKCPLCQKRIKEEDLKDEHELQSYFIQRIEKFLLTKGRKIIGWDEILEGGLAPEATVMSWRGTKGGIEAAKQKHDVIMTPGSHCYFDHYQDKNYLEPTAIGGYTPLKKVYEFEPTPDDLTEEEAKYILGAQGNVWTEYMHTSDHVEYMVAPRICALSEVVWTTKVQRDWDDFQKRLPYHYHLLKSKNINYHVQVPHGGANRNFFSEDMELALSVDVPNAEICYTTDGSEPNSSSPVYQNPIRIENTITVKAQTYLESGASSMVRIIECIKTEALKTASRLNARQGLEYKVYEGKFNTVEEIKDGKPIQTGIVESLQYPKGIKTDFYGLEISGYLVVEKDATYTFYNYSIDPAELRIGSKLLLEHKGLNSRHEQRARIYLRKGIYPIRMLLVRNTSYAYQKISWSSVNFDQTPIPLDNLKH